METLVPHVRTYGMTMSCPSGIGKYQIAQICQYSSRGTNFSLRFELPPVCKNEIRGKLAVRSAFRSVQNLWKSSTNSTPHFSRKNDSELHALADKVALGFGANKSDGRKDADDVQEQTAARDAVDFNWEEQWYPLYLTDDIPGDAPIALSVFDRQLVVYRDGEGKLSCLEDRCPHRAAKLSEGQIIDGKIECLYHGWQFEGDGTCAKIPQLAPGATIPKRACARPYAVKESQGVLWVWMAEKSKAPDNEIPYFDSYEREGHAVISSYNEFPYDASILLENVMDPAHIHISHDRVDQSGRREKAQAMVFEVTERSAKGFAGRWSYVTTPQEKNITRFIGPCVVYNEKETPDKKILFNTVVLIRSIGQGKSVAMLRFGAAIEGKKNPFPRLPLWIYHMRGSTILEQDLGFLCSQNEVLVREEKPTSEVYLNMRSLDRWVEEYRMWLDRIGHGMPYYWGHRTLKVPDKTAVEEAHPAGLAATIASSTPSKGAFVHKYARDPSNRYFRHVVHCKSCRGAVANFKKLKVLSLVLAALSAGMGIIASKPVWRRAFVLLALFLCAASWGCRRILSSLTENYIRPHKLTP